MPENYRIEIADTNEKYEGLRALWCEVFDDEPEFVDSLYELFAGDIKGYVAVDEEGEVVSALTRFNCGKFENRDVHVSYAICTRADVRGLGLAGRLVDMARDEVLDAGGISIISPAEPSLEEFYGAHGYIPYFYVSREIATEYDSEDFLYDESDDEYEKAEAVTELAALDADTYNKYREDFLMDIPHVILNDRMMTLVQAESRMPGGESGLLLINGGDAICALNADEDGKLEIEELLTNPHLISLSPEIAEELALRIGRCFGKDVIAYKAPAGMEAHRDDARCQSMAAGLAGSEEFPYYGFPIE